MHFSFDHDLGAGSLLLVILAVAVAVVWMYRRAFQSGSDRRMWKLIALRTAALLLVICLLFRPMLSYERTQQQAGEIVVLIDTSGSMSVEDDPQGHSRLEQAQRALQEIEPEVFSSFKLRFARFDSDVSTLKNAGAVGMLEAEGEETNLADGIRTAVLSGSKEKTVAAIVFSDGIDNSGSDLLNAVKAPGVPIHTVATGYNLSGTEAGRDVMVQGVECPEQLRLNTRSRITALIEARGLEGRVARVELLEQDNVIAENSITLDRSDGIQRVELSVTPETKGRHEYTIRVPRLSDERIDKNNSHSVSAIVVDPHLRILYVEGGIRAEYGTLVGRYLAHDPTVEYLALVQTRPGMFIQRTNIAEWNVEGLPSDRSVLETFDVFLIGDLDSQFLGSERMAVIEQLVSEGKGLMMIGGSHSFGGGNYGGTPIGQALPVELGESTDQIDEPFQLQLTSAGYAHPVFGGIVDFFKTGESTADVPALPPLLGCAVLDRPKPSAEVLAVHPERGYAEGPLPVLAIHTYGKGRAAAFAGDTTHRWYQVMRGLEEKSPYIRFWGQMLRWLAGKKETETLEPGLTVNTDKGFYEPGQPITLDALLIGEDGRGRDDADIEASFQPSSANNKPVIVPLEPRADRPGAYLVQYVPEHPGLYRVEISARIGGELRGESRLQIQVGYPSREFDHLDLDETALQTIAEATNGQYVHVARVDRLFDGLVQEQRRKRILLEQRLYHPPLFWMLCIGLITTEWLLRKKYRLR